ncbi:MAG: hypothetical protein JSU78_07380 [Deltaproteobacteria bacterium]|nr:MAG: hypothetical protein JSU78_07380 [Deltaproteobacteria bacterium]
MKEDIYPHNLAKTFLQSLSRTLRGVGEAEEKTGQWIDYYNYRRTHMGIG